MKYILCLISIILMIQIGCVSRQVREEKVMDEQTGNTDLLKYVESIKKKEKLTVLRDYEDSGNYINEYDDYYEVTFKGRTAEGYTGGAYCIKVDKKTGKEEMLWDEHPMRDERYEARE